ncbi:MAG: hypothetical protein J0L83_03830 [Chitinophagales bacterium]|nr:hypothetical protein [Chitinophagales bacterium]
MNKKRQIKSKLNSKQQYVLEEFLITFLPKTGHKRKNPANEFEYIHTTLNKVFIKHLGFKLTADDVLFALETLGYNFFPLKGTWDTEDKSVRPSKSGDLIRYGTAYSKYEASFLYVEVKADTVRFLKRTTTTLPPHTKPDKNAKTNLLLNHIKHFKKNHTESE